MSLVVSLSTNPEVRVRQILEGKANVSNPDSPMVDNVVLTIQLPVSFQFKTVAPTQGTCTFVGNRIVCTLGAIELGGAVDVTFQLVPTKPGVYTLEATATGTVGGFPITSNKATARVRVPGSPLSQFRTPGLLTCDTAKPACTPPFRRAPFIVRLRP